MDELLVEKYAKRVRRISKGLMVWNILGVIVNLLGGSVTFLFLIPGFRKALEELAKEPSHSLEAALIKNFGLVSFMLLILGVLGIFASVLYARISKFARNQQYSYRSYLYYVIGIHIYSVISEIVQQLILGQRITIGLFILPVVIGAFIVWLYVSHEGLRDALGGDVDE